jgi:hypothetical protein
MQNSRDVAEGGADVVDRWHVEGTDRGTRSLLTGAIVGALGGWLVGLRAFAIPYVGPFITVGSVALGAGIGTIASALLGIDSLRNVAGKIRSQARRRRKFVPLLRQVRELATSVRKGAAR